MTPRQRSDDRHVRPERKPEAKEEVAVPKIGAESGGRVIGAGASGIPGSGGCSGNPYALGASAGSGRSHEDKPSHTVRNLLLVALLVLIAGGGYVWFAMNQGAETRWRCNRAECGVGGSRGVARRMQQRQHRRRWAWLRGAVEDGGVGEVADNAADEAAAPESAATEGNDIKGTAAAPAIPQQAAPETSAKSVAREAQHRGSPRCSSHERLPAKPVPAKAAPAKAKFGDGVANAGRVPADHESRGRDGGLRQ